MKYLQTETRTATRYYLQWRDDKGQYGTPGAWMTTGDDGYLLDTGYDSVDEARTKGVAECFPSFPADKRPPYRIVQRVMVETVIPN